MRRYWIERESFGAAEDGSTVVVFQREAHHHIVVVCKQGMGAKFEVLTDEGKAYFVEMTYVGKRQATARVLEERVIEPLAKPYIHLCVSMPKFAKMDTIVEKSVELGVKSIKPFVSDFSYVKSLGKILESKKKRWDKIIISASQQSGRGELMEVAEPESFDRILDRFKQKTNPSSDAVGLFFYEGESSLGVKEALKRASSSTYEHVWVFVGSEGGFSLGEVEKFKVLGLEPISLGSQILRVETACVVLPSIIKYELVLE